MTVFIQGTITHRSKMIEPCSLVEIDRRFRGAYCLHKLTALMMEAVSVCKLNFETFVIEGYFSLFSPFGERKTSTF
jgi:hypothetical protein